MHSEVGRALAEQSGEGAALAPALTAAFAAADEALLDFLDSDGTNKRWGTLLSAVAGCWAVLPQELTRVLLPGAQRRCPPASAKPAAPPLWRW